jgi:hypothetical protein
MFRLKPTQVPITVQNFKNIEDAGLDSKGFLKLIDSTITSSNSQNSNTSNNNTNNN